jgi:hypothetical protein
MRFHFNKDKDNQINILLEMKGKKQTFSYIEMIKEIIVSGKLEASIISESFTEAEIKSIGSMIGHMNKVIDEIKKDTEEVPRRTRQ